MNSLSVNKMIESRLCNSCLTDSGNSSYVVTRNEGGEL
jgi:hypothetical protein